MKNRSRHCDPRRDTDMTVNHSLLTTERKAVQQPNSTAGTVSIPYCSLERMTLNIFFLLWSQVLSSLTIYDLAGQSENRKSVSVQAPLFFPHYCFLSMPLLICCSHSLSMWKLGRAAGSRFQHCFMMLYTTSGQPSGQSILYPFSTRGTTSFRG